MKKSVATRKGAVVLSALLAVACAAATDSVPSSPSLSPSPSDRQAVQAPIDGLEVRVLESNPVQYVLNVKAGLPSGCAEKNGHDVAWAGEQITVTVLNW